MKRKGTKVIEKFKNNHKMHRIISNILIVLGIALFIGVITVNIRDISKSIKSVKDFKSKKAEENIANEVSLPIVENNIKVENAYVNPHEEVDDNNETDEDKETNTVKYSSGELICLLRLPKISLEEAVREGDSRDVFSSALCHLEKTPYPGETGNCCISGHRNYVFGKFFNRLNEIAVGDTVELETTDNTYIYRVYETLVVKPNDITVLDSTEEKTLTLITCTPLFVGTHRLIVKAVLVE